MSDGANALAPNPAWTPPQSSGDIPPNIAAPMPTETTPPVNVSTTTPQVDTLNAPQSSQMVPYIDPEVAAGHAHQNWLAHILDTVGTILAGDQTIHITKSPDGTMSVTHDPSTTGEKWARVAHAAILGGAQGMAHGQGPGGTAQAIAAGTMAGAAMPEQQLQAANQQAAQMNAQQLAAANNALLHQKMVISGLQAQSLGMTVGEQQAKLLNDLAQTTMDSPNAQVLPRVTSMQEIAALQNSYADFFKTHTNNQMKVFVTPDAQGKIGFTPVIVDRAYNERRNDKIEKGLKLAVDPQTKEPIFDFDPIPVGAQKMSDINTANQAVTAKLIDLHNKWLTATGAGKQEKIETNPLAMQLAAEQETDPVKRQQKIDALNADQQRRIQIARESRPPAAGLPGGNEPAPAGSFDPAFPPPQNFPAGTPGIVPKQIGKVPAAASTKASLARNINENTAAATRIIQAQGDQLLGPALGRITSVEQMVGSDNPAISELGTRIHNIAMASVGIHGSRAVGNVHDQEMNLLNHFKAGKTASLAALAANLDSAQTFINEERNWQTYGSATGPIRQGATNTTPPPPQTSFTPMTPPAGQSRPGYAFGMGPQGKGWYKQ